MVCPLMPWGHKEPGPWFNIKMSSYPYGKSHYGDKTILRPSYLHNGISHTGKMASLYWIRNQGTSRHDIALSGSAGALYSLSIRKVNQKKKFHKGNDEVLRETLLWLIRSHGSWIGTTLQQWKIWHKWCTALSTTGVSFTVINIDVITHPCPNSNGGLATPPLKLGMERVIKSNINLWLYNIIGWFSCLPSFLRLKHVS